MTLPDKVVAMLEEQLDIIIDDEKLFTDCLLAVCSSLELLAFRCKDQALADELTPVATQPSEICDNLLDKQIAPWIKELFIKASTELK